MSDGRSTSNLLKEIRDLKGVLSEEHDCTDNFKHDLENECEVTKSLERELKTFKEKESMPHM